ncbi:hypothetical protein [Kineococcus sp. SYSU DK003]|uniref:hypothetical protein n=1 Tax=Kineococcus sp. SYSU DK003 TaxID=3383124 RepID=UPI003D7DD011
MTAGEDEQERSGDERSDGEGAADEDARRRWVSWLLVAACLLPVVLVGEAGRRVLTGAYDADFFGISPDQRGLDAGATDGFDLPVSRRFSVLWFQMGLPGPLLAGPVAALAVAAVVLAGRPAWLVPDRWGRRVAAAGAGLAGLQALLVTAGLVHGVSGAADEGTGSLELNWYGPTTNSFPEVAGALALLLPAIVVPVVAGLVIWRAGPAGAPVADVEEGVPEPATAAAPTAGEPPEEEPGHEPGQEAGQASSVPVVPEDERHLYRRPG